MSGVLSDVVSAALADPLFTEQDCRDLDQVVGRQSRDLKGLEWLDDVQIKRLQNDLNCIASGWSAQRVVNLAKPAARLQRIEAIKSRCDELVGLLGVGPQSPSWDIMLEHLIGDGIFQDETVDYEFLVSSLRTLSRLSEGAADRINARPKTKLVLADYRLVDDLGAAYKHYWGRGHLPASVNDGKGGPSVDFFLYTWSRILGRRIPPQRVLDAVVKIRSGNVDLSEVYSPFTPQGGSRILTRRG